MQADDEGVAGFFEDLPVLMFVLAGVFIIVSAGVWSSNTLAGKRLHSELEALADDLANDIVLKVTARAGAGQLPSLNILSTLDLKRLAAEAVPSHHFSIAIIERCPEMRWLANCSEGTDCHSFEAAGAARLLNALDGQLRVAVVEVRALVW